MNALLTFLTLNQERLNLRQFGSLNDFTTLVATPRFKASGHLVFFVLKRDEPRPVIIAKVPRVACDHHRLDREARNLQDIQRLRPNGFDTIPRLIAYEEYGGYRFLIETAVPGNIMRPAHVRRKFESSLRAGYEWLSVIHRLSSQRRPCVPIDSARLLYEPLSYLERLLTTSNNREVLAKTRLLFDGVDWNGLPAIFEHGDFSSPNLLIEESRLGVVDWELADPFGLPMTDFFFLLTYLAFAKQGARNNPTYLRAFHDAFFDNVGWARPYGHDFAEKVGVDPCYLVPLFVTCWMRYVSGLVQRLDAEENGISDDVLHWLQTNRYYLLWRHTIANLDLLHF